MLVLGVDDDVPLRVATSHFRHHVHRSIVVVHAQLAIGTSKGHAGMECAARAKAEVMVEAYGTVLLARP
jgi:hypothetical protein